MTDSTNRHSCFKHNKFFDKGCIDCIKELRDLTK